VTSIDILLDDVLLAIFDFWADEYQGFKPQIEAWQSLVHVCRRWRSVVFGSPRRLNLRLVCTPGTSVRATLDVWPPLPLVIQNGPGHIVEADNIVAALERRDRVDEIYLWEVNSSPLERILAVMHVPFPELRYLLLLSREEMVLALPDSFLGGSTPRLQFLELNGIPFPGLPKLPLSATHLVGLDLMNIPHSGYISPEAVVTTLSTLTSLESLWLGFQSPRSHPDLAIRRLFPPTRTVLPVLTHFWFKGVCEYLDNFVARIDTPRLYDFSITFNDIIFDVPQFIQSISRIPASKALENAHVVFGHREAWVNFSSQTLGGRSFRVEVRVLCREMDSQVSSLEQVCTLCSSLLPMLENLYIYKARSSDPHWQDNIENTLWLELLRSFPAVKNLYLYEEFARRIVPALQELVDGRTTEVLPIMQNIFLEKLQPSEPLPEGIQQFVATRQVTGHPIAVSRWPRDGTVFFPAR
jgi:hypothetical protein